MDKSLVAFCGAVVKGLFQLVLFIPRELWRHLWKKQAVLRWKKEVSQHWHNHCTELCLPRTSESLPYHFCAWSRTQLWLPGEFHNAPHWCMPSDLNKLVCFAPLSFNLRLFFLLPPSMTLDQSVPQENPKAKTRRRRAIISCMQELRLETSSTITNSLAAVCATSARFWRRRETTVLLVCLF